LIAILALPPVLLAQNTGELEIKIENGDTTINGKNIKELSAKDRKNALRDIKHLNGETTTTWDNGKNGNVYFFKRRDTTGGRTSRMEFRSRELQNGGRQPMITENMVMKDSLGNVIVRTGRLRRMDSNSDFRNRMDGGMSLSGGFMGPGMRRERRNTQNFNYVNTDNEGISTHVSFHVSEVSNDDLKKMPYIEGGKFEITDLNIVPEFTSGKTLLLFNLPAKTVAEVKLHDSEGKLLWSEKSTGGSFSKTFTLGLNGIYYLQVKQGNSVAVKRIMKEE
jgi:hypothetical protein